MMFRHQEMMKVYFQLGSKFNLPNDLVYFLYSFSKKEEKRMIQETKIFYKNIILYLTLGYNIVTLNEILNTNKDLFNHCLPIDRDIEWGIRCRRDKVKIYLTTPDYSKRVDNFQNCKDSEISFDKMMNIYWKNNIIAKLIKGSTITNPKIFLSNFILLDEIDKSNLKKRLSKFIKKSIASFLSPITLLDSKDKRAINGVIYQLNESLGAIKLYKEKKVISNLSVNDIEILMESGVKIGELFIWVPKLFEKRNREYLWSLRQIFYESNNGSTYPSIETIINKKNAPKEILNSNEFILIGENYYNVQLIEKIIKEIKVILKHKKIFFSTRKNSSYFRKKYKLSHSQLKDILHILNFKRDKINPVKYIRKDNNLKKKSYIKVNKNNSPFAVLEKLN